ncbi:MAG: hypothetical protein VKI83_12280, partial [Synechococcaceae cyanobacterium]|nr:hypothetical protein [Synechococcaceae cyanobacterium]
SAINCVDACRKAVPVVKIERRFVRNVLRLQNFQQSKDFHNSLAMGSCLCHLNNRLNAAGTLLPGGIRSCLRLDASPRPCSGHSFLSCMHHFHNALLAAPNVLEIDLNLEVIGEFHDLIQRPLSAETFHIASPQWQSNIQWISPNTLECFRFFYHRFLQLGVSDHVKPFLDLEQRCMMYSGFLVARSHCTQADFHLDWIDANNEAFTLITPITANCQGFGLLYQRSDGSVAEYDYKLGKALVFGDSFLHATKPGKSEEPVVLLSFTFGTDKMEHWPAIARTAGSQGNLLRLPNGDFRVRDMEP